MAEKEFSGTKIELLISMLKQPSTIKGIIGLAGVLGWSFTEMQFNEVVAGLASIYFLVAIFWQKG